LVFYLDASLPPDVLRGLALVRHDVLYPGGPGCPIAGPWVPDDEWLPVAGRDNWIVLMRDKRIRYRPGERQRLLENNVRAFCLTGAGNYSKWQILELLIRRWSDIQTAAEFQEPPYIYSVTQGGITLLAPIVPVVGGQPAAPEPLAPGVTEQLELGPQLRSRKRPGASHPRRP